ncbi:hypothetical protein J2792_000812 [Novosphingobium capsulatum]|uniref:Uncharacterized protein n=1 Tax=Novosphingobium capsulatum TaxID=13688 RepID=A0ABU1MIU7_9SPHN|nr:hypothetical protein [Novosphingobium capsulatum]MDR6509972.1 hypothetical protein [Novosphingobium capsulatum]
MDFDDQMRRYFGAADPASVAPAALAAGMERLSVDFGLERDPGRRFAMWALMHILGNAPDLDVAFPDPAERDAARNFMDMLDQLQAQAPTDPG